MTRFKINLSITIIAQERNLREFHTITCRDAVKTSTAFRYHALILLTGHRRQRNIHNHRHIAPVADLPESYKDALAGVIGTFQANF